MSDNQQPAAVVEAALAACERILAELDASQREGRFSRIDEADMRAALAAAPAPLADGREVECGVPEPLYTEQSVREYIQKFIDLGIYASIADAARCRGMSDETLRLFLTGKRPPSGMILKAFCFERAVYYRDKGAFDAALPNKDQTK